MFQLYDEIRKRRYALTGLIKEIGRTSECDIALPEDSKVSRLHARLEWNGETWVLVDAGSTNGTFVNGQKVTEWVLKVGDVLEIGDAQLRYLPLPAGDGEALKKTTEVNAVRPAAVQERARRRQFKEGATVADEKKKGS
jgi:pSer/pThr/pTyr-binding forkhead associated (FHA) protein